MLHENNRANFCLILPGTFGTICDTQLGKFGNFDLLRGCNRENLEFTLFTGMTLISRRIAYLLIEY